MQCKIRIENTLIDRHANIMVGKHIGELSKKYSNKKLSANDYQNIAILRADLARDKSAVLSKYSIEFQDALRLAPLYMVAYLLYLSTIEEVPSPQATT